MKSKTCFVYFSNGQLLETLNFCLLVHYSLGFEPFCSSQQVALKKAHMGAWALHSFDAALWALHTTYSLSQVLQCSKQPVFWDGQSLETKPYYALWAYKGLVFQCPGTNILLHKELNFVSVNRWRYTTVRCVRAHLMQLIRTYIQSKFCWLRKYSFSVIP